ncbi:hypothetical protein [Herbiconiux daphne]|uniref:Uncharacterized protein n=1 Tax=Herbiconiux daphne TaxID=2970914 RepID=A0ABT2H1J3_9MICO|nr:hypothetical protein [Herbiconiux daphne]MCS5733792.1 hypothetical protein [Herbiconiux daphne]
MADKFITSLKLENGNVTHWIGKAATKADTEEAALEAAVVGSSLVKA